MRHPADWPNLRDIYDRFKDGPTEEWVQSEALRARTGVDSGVELWAEFTMMLLLDLGE